MKSAFRNRRVALLLMTLAACCDRGLLTVSSEPSELSNSTTRDLYLLVLAPFPIPTREIYVYSAAYSLLAGVDVALEIINERSDILPGYRLTYVAANSACTYDTRAVVALAENTFNSERNVAGIVGPACSGAASAVAPLIARDDQANLLQVTIATSPQLTGEKYPNTYLALSSALVYVDIFIALQEKYDWSRVGVFFEMNRFYFLSTFRSFQKKVPSNRMTFVTGIDDFFLPVVQARDEQVRVLFVFVGGTLTLRMMCIAFHEGVIYPRHQWIFHDKNIQFYLKNVSFTLQGKHFHCTREQIQRALEGAIFARYALERDPQSDTTEFIGDINYAEYLVRYNQKLTEGNEFDVYANAYYDAVWTMALSLNNSMAWFEGHNSSLSDYNYRKIEATEEIRRQLLDLSFNGITGLIEYKHRESQTRVDLYQIVPTNDSESNNTHVEKKVGEYITSLELLGGAEFVENTFENVLDISIHERVIAIVALVLLALVISASTVLIAISIIFINHPAVKASSPHLNVFIFSGCCLVVVGVMTAASGPAFLTNYVSFSAWVHSLLCVMPWWCFNMGYSLIFGTLCGKTWRVYRIFMVFTSEHHFISDRTIIMFVLGLLTFDIIINLSFSVANPCYLQVVEAHFDGSDQVQVTVGCNCQYQTLEQIYVAIMATSKGLLLFMLVFLAILTRHIKKPMFKNTSGIAVITFCILFINGVGLPLIQFVTIQSVWTSVILLIMFSSPVVLCLLFIFFPPILPLFRVNYDLVVRRVSSVSLVSSTTLTL